MNIKIKQLNSEADIWINAINGILKFEGLMKLYKRLQVDMKEKPNYRQTFMDEFLDKKIKFKQLLLKF